MCLNRAQVPTYQLFPMISNHELNLVRLLGDDTIDLIRRDICDELNIPFCEENMQRVDEIIKRSWTPETLGEVRRDMRHDAVWRIINGLLAAVPMVLLGKTCLVRGAK